MNPATDLTCTLRTSGWDIDLITERVWSLVDPDLDLGRHCNSILKTKPKGRQSVLDPDFPFIDWCVDGTYHVGDDPSDRGFQSGRYVRVYRFNGEDGDPDVEFYGPFTGRGWKEEMALQVVQLTQTLYTETDPGYETVASTMEVLQELSDASMMVADLFCETRFILPPDLLEHMSVVHYEDEDGETSFGFLGVLNAALKGMGSQYLIVSRWGGDDQSEFIGFGVMRDGELVDF